MNIVIAGNYEQYRCFLREHRLNPRLHIYVHDEEQILGMSDVNCYFVGTYENNPCYGSYRLRDMLDRQRIKQCFFE